MLRGTLRCRVRDPKTGQPCGKPDAVACMLRTWKFGSTFLCHLPESGEPVDRFLCQARLGGESSTLLLCLYLLVLGWGLCARGFFLGVERCSRVFFFTVK